MNTPNILVIMTDQHHADFLGFTGKRDVFTPNIDRLAANGVNFSNAFSVHGIWGPSRTSCLTGSMRIRTGFTVTT